MTVEELVKHCEEEKMPLTTIIAVLDDEGGEWESVSAMFSKTTNRVVIT